MEALAESDPYVMTITAAMCTGTGLVNYSRRFEKQFLDVGIAEGHAVTAAAGMAIAGVRPFVTIYSTFLQRGFDNIMHDVALQNLPVVFAMDRSGLVGFDGPTHHGLLDVAYMRILPNMVVMAPKDADELRAMLLTAHKHTSGPVALRYPRAGVQDEPKTNLDGILPVPIGKAEIVEEGDGTLCLISYGHIFGNVMKAAAILASRGYQVGVVNGRFAKPLDEGCLLNLAQRYDALVTVEEAAEAGGFGSAVNEFFARSGTQKQALILGVPDVWIEHGDQTTQQSWAGLDPDQIADRAEAYFLKCKVGSKGSVPAQSLSLETPHLTPLLESAPLTPTA
jgi:1-deoxy-D-xylulose-5-phosphate synthase